ncbi:hypothetical protein [Streptomyces sp. MB09-02B]|uniref:hypothetical protein n=1 Tax=Streptomyces sp. MB09-02B TaxID=3028667 RepID=UPI0029AD4995|nr:hypothetical protein [Streptomyces sp. MB09-02B]MDX3641425.1 hypothetical protein [Streptomyces sp. MB09-02B]
MKHRSIVSAFVSLAAVSGLALGGCTTEDGESTPAPTQETQTNEGGEEPQGGREEPEANERQDLLSFKIDDRSQAGITSIWVTWTIKNNSSEKSNYSWDWEAVDANSTRVANGTQLENDVQPGQTANGEFPTTLKTSDVKLNITDFNRTKAF